MSAQAWAKAKFVVLFANEELGYDGARAYANKDSIAISRHKVAAESDWGTDRTYAFRSRQLNPSLTAAIGRVLAPIGIATENTDGTPGPDLGALSKKGVSWVQFPIRAADRRLLRQFALHTELGPGAGPYHGAR